jgi:signal transduction histidine kinase/DNA-binding LytR/AlgR family response regulator
MDDIHVLVVDNSPVIRRILGYVLEGEGCVVDMAEDGLAALDCIGRQRPDIIFTDLIMPKIDGEKLGYIIRNTPELRDIFLVVLSGVALEDNDTTLRIGADVCIAKGTATSMKAHIKVALDRYRNNQRGASRSIEGMEGLYPREVTRELLISKQHRDVVLARMTEGVVELNHEGRIVMANRAALALFDLPEAKVLGSPLHQLLPEAAGDRIDNWISRILPLGDYQPLVFTYDEPLLVGAHQVTCNLVPVPEDEVFFVIGILQDVSRRKALEVRQRQLEKELQRIRKLDAMSMMASGIAHDFNNLLTVISGNLEMARYVSRDENVNQLLGESAKALNLTTQLIRQFTTFSDNYLPQKSQVELPGLIHDILSHVLAPTGIDFQLTTGKQDLAVTLDSDLIRQVFVNLTNNALEAMGHEGHIRVSIDQVDGVEEAARTGQPIPAGLMARIAFHDSGPGIPSSIIDQVFDPYFSTKQKGAQKGMGLGLTIVHSIVKKHGGLVWIEKAQEGGCRVLLYFPLQTAKTGAGAIEVAPGRGRRILVMDDEEMMRLINRKMFEHYGCMVSVATSGEEAVSLFRQQREAGQPFDLCLLDLRVHGGMGGLEAAREIMQIDPEAQLVAVSGDPGSEEMQHYREYHFVAALAKPFSIDVVEEIVLRLLQPQPAAE